MISTILVFVLFVKIFYFLFKHINECGGENVVVEFLMYELKILYKKFIYEKCHKTLIKLKIY